MMKINRLATFLLIFAIVLAISSLRAVFAQSVSVEGNGVGSNNSLNFNSANSTNINQNNSAEVNNETGVNCNTGNNSTSSNSGGNNNTNSGNCSASVSIQNNVNSNQANVDCPNCQKASPTPIPPTGGSTDPGGNNGGGSSGNGSSGGGSNSTSSSPQILAGTGTAKSTAFFLAGLAFYFLGLGSIGRSLKVFN